jgi:outer membrane protein assembly factor BamB
VRDGTAYLAAGLTCQDGTHVYALDAATGRIRWQNNDAGHLDRFSRRGVSAQGDTLLRDGKLFLAGGNAVSPGIFDAATGKCLNAPPADAGSTAPRGRELRVAADGGIHVSGQPLWSTAVGSQVFDGSVRWERAVVAAKGARLSLEDRPKAGSWALVARKPEGGDLWAQALPGEPVRWGLAVDREGRIPVALRDGRIVCFGSRP